MSLSVLKPGLYSTVQDLGRPGWRKDGVAEGGAMDRYALRMANLLVGNPEGTAALELTLIGPQLRLESDLLLAVCGATMPPSIDGEELPLWRPVWARSGAVLTFGAATGGCRAYLAAGGGFVADEALGSRGTDARAGIGGLAGRPLRGGDALRCAAPSPLAAARRETLAARAAAEPAGRRRDWAAAGWFAPPLAYGGASEDGIELRVVPGAEYGQFREAARTALMRERYRVAPASDRMGVRLDGPPLERADGGELPSHGVVAGTIQVPAGGSPIILAADCQTTGGYPKIAHVITADLPLLAQCKPGDWITFAEFTLAEAQRLYLACERSMKLLAVAMNLKP